MMDKLLAITAQILTALVIIHLHEQYAVSIPSFLIAVIITLIAAIIYVQYKIKVGEKKNQEIEAKDQADKIINFENLILLKYDFDAEPDNANPQTLSEILKTLSLPKIFMRHEEIALRKTIFFLGIAAARKNRKRVYMMPPLKELQK